MALLAQYIFNDNANDEQGSYNGTASNLTYETKPSGYQFSGKVAIFNGSSSKIDLPNIAGISGGSARTIECWMYTATGVVVFFTSGDTTNYVNYWRVSTSVLRAGSLGANADSTSGVGNNTWTHVAITLSSNNSSAFKFYINGSEVGRNSTTDTINTANTNLGIGYLRSLNNYYFSGKLANFRIYDEAVSAATLLSHYNAEKYTSPSSSVSLSPSVSVSLSPSSSQSPSSSISLSPSRSVSLSPSASVSPSSSASASVSPSSSVSLSQSRSPSRSQSRSISATPSPSSSISLSPSSSISRSPSPSSSISLSPSVSVSLSPSSSFSASPSPSSSISPSPSVSESRSSSLSISPSPSAGYSDYTRGNYAALPTNDNDLETAYSAQDYIDVATKDNVRVGQTATLENMIHQFKNFVGDAPRCMLEWEGQTTQSTALSTVYLQIYNFNTTTWDTVDSDNSSAIDTDFTLMADILDLTNYKDASNVISCRVYQGAL